MVDGYDALLFWTRAMADCERTDSDLIVAKLFVLTWNDCVALLYPA